MSLEDIRKKVSSGSFPNEALEDAKSVLCLFAAGFLGQNDVIHVYNAGITDVTLVDSDIHLLGVMAEMYPSCWEYKVDDAYTFFRARTWDVVIVDPWTAHMGKCLGLLEKWAQLAKTIIIGVSKPWFDKQNLPVSDLGLQEWVEARTDLTIESLQLRKRSDYRGGVYWATVNVL